MVVSKLDDFTSGSFYEVINDSLADPDLVDKIVFTSGRLYYDLQKHQVENGISNIALVRLEQVYPIPLKEIDNILKKYKKATQLIWAQDEPENMGVWPFIDRKLKYYNFTFVGRKESASPAVGLMEIHKQGLEKILESVFKESKVTAS